MVISYTIETYVHIIHIIYTHACTPYILTFQYTMTYTYILLITLYTIHIHRTYTYLSIHYNISVLVVAYAGRQQVGVLVTD